MSTPVAETPRLPRPTEELDQVTIRFSGDSGDGMQITGSQFTNTSAVLGNDLATFPDFPAEIRAPTGTTFGVSDPRRGCKSAYTLSVSSVGCGIPPCKPSGTPLEAGHSHEQRRMALA